MRGACKGENTKRPVHDHTTMSVMRHPYKVEVRFLKHPYGEADRRGKRRKSWVDEAGVEKEGKWNYHFDLSEGRRDEGLKDLESEVEPKPIGEKVQGSEKMLEAMEKKPKGKGEAHESTMEDVQHVGVTENVKSNMIRKHEGKDELKKDKCQTPGGQGEANAMAKKKTQKKELDLKVCPP